jgi:hypothetical protein
LKLHHQLLALAASLVVVSLGLVTCVQQHGAPDTEGFPIAAITLSDSSGVSDSQPSAEEQPDASPPPLTPVPQTDENCLGCHTDVEDLQALATEEESPEAVSSGEG